MTAPSYTIRQQAALCYQRGKGCYDWALPPASIQRFVVVNGSKYALVTAVAMLGLYYLMRPVGHFFMQEHGALKDHSWTQVGIDSALGCSITVEGVKALIVACRIANIDSVAFLFTPWKASESLIQEGAPSSFLDKTFTRVAPRGSLRRFVSLRVSQVFLVIAASYIALFYVIRPIGHQIVIADPHREQSPKDESVKDLKFGIMGCALAATFYYFIMQAASGCHRCAIRSAAFKLKNLSSSGKEQGLL